MNSIKTLTEKIRQVAHAIHAAPITAGAGMGVDSEPPDFSQKSHCEIERQGLTYLQRQQLLREDLSIPACIRARCD